MVRRLRQPENASSVAPAEFVKEKEARIADLEQRLAALEQLLKAQAR